jgi:hypothetical protein
MIAFSVVESVFFVRFRESAKIAFVQARKKIAVCKNNADYEDGLVINLEMARDVLLNANQTHLERDLQQGCPFFFGRSFSSVVICRCYTG